MPPREVTLDLSDARRILGHVLTELNRIDGTKTMTDYDRGRTRVNDPEAAAISRALQRLGDLTDSAASVFRVRYWEFKGFRDPLDTAKRPPADPALRPAE